MFINYQVLYNRAIIFNYIAPARALWHSGTPAPLQLQHSLSSHKNFIIQVLSPRRLCD